jgi:hypothetical protein
VRAQAACRQQVKARTTLDDAGLARQGRGGSAERLRPKRAPSGRRRLVRIDWEVEWPPGEAFLRTLAAVRRATSVGIVASAAAHVVRAFVAGPELFLCKALRSVCNVHPFRYRELQKPSALNGSPSARGGKLFARAPPCAGGPPPRGPPPARRPPRRARAGQPASLCSRPCPVAGSIRSARKWGLS